MNTRIHTVSVINEANVEQTYSIDSPKGLFHVGGNCTANDDILLPNKSKDWTLLVTSNNCYCTLHNIGSETIDFNGMPLYPQKKQKVNYNRPCKLDEYSFSFFFNKPSSNMAVEVDMPNAYLKPDTTRDAPLEADITLYNHGDRSQVQFKLRIEGANLREGESFDLSDGAPKLVYVRQEKVKLMLYHSETSQLLGGRHCIQIYAESDDYPEDVAVAIQEVKVEEIYDHELSFKD